MVSALLLTRLAKCEGRGWTKNVSPDVLIMPILWNREKRENIYSYSEAYVIGLTTATVTNPIFSLRYYYLFKHACDERVNMLIKPIISKMVIRNV